MRAGECLSVFARKFTSAAVKGLPEGKYEEHERIFKIPHKVKQM